MPERESRPADNQAADISTAIKIEDSVLQPVTLSAYRSDVGQLWVWCEHEQLWHRHGGRCSCDDDPCSCPPGSADGHRGAHCCCPRSPYAAAGYVLAEAGPLTQELLERHRDTSWLHGCREGWCRRDRAARLHARRHPAMLPNPDDPLSVAKELVKGYAAIDWTDRDEEAAWQGLWETPNVDPKTAEAIGLTEPPMQAPPLDYEPAVHGPLTLRRWRGAWMQWDQAHWRALEDGELQADLYQQLGDAHYLKAVAKALTWVPWKPNRRSVGEVLAALESLVQLPSDVDAPRWISPWNRDRSTQLVSCANGLLDIRTRMLEDHDPNWFNLVSVPFDFDPFAPTPERWLQFLADLWPEDQEAIDALQEWFGYVLSGRTDLQKMLLVVGPPRSGKGTIVRILQELVGRGNYAGPTLASLGTNFGLQALIGKPLAVVADARLGGRDTHTVVERLLSISGEDTLTVDRKYRDAWTGRLPSRITVLSNELPHFGDASGAIATRFITLTLTRSWLGNEDIGLERRLHSELAGILCWALDGLARLDHRRRFTEPASSVESVMAMADSASPTGAFVRDMCTVGAGQEIRARELYAAWRGWCLDNGRDHPGNEQTFGRTLRSVVPALRLTRPRDPVTGARVRTYQGLTLVRVGPRPYPMSSQISHYLPIEPEATT